jgi:hypothetical protein
MKTLPAILLVVLLAGFIGGLIHLFNLRFEAGDNYPPYSSLRADPLGTKALYESLDRIVPVRRHLQPLSKLGEGRDTTLFWLGEEAKDLRFLPSEFKDLETFVRTGGRLVIGLLPIVDRPRMNRFVTRPPGGRVAPPAGAPTNSPGLQPGEEFADPRKISIRDRWKLSFAYAELSKTEDKKIAPASAVRRATNDSALPGGIAIHTTLCFTRLDPDWRVIYARVSGTNDSPVLIERPMGKGSIVLCADSFPFSNEALRRERQPGLLAWFISSAREAVFDETHLGVQADPGVATLARKYRLAGAFVALLLLAGLFIWKNSLSFLPPHAEQVAAEQGDHVEGKDSASGFINLLRRNIAPSDLMKVCLEQWNAHFAHARKPSRAKLEAMQRVIDAENAREPGQRDSVRMYREFCRILSGRFEFRVSSFECKQTNTTKQPEH